MKELLGQIAIGTIILAVIMIGFEHISPRLTKIVGERVNLFLSYLGMAMLILAAILVVIAIAIS